MSWLTGAASWLMRHFEMSFWPVVLLSLTPLLPLLLAWRFQKRALTDSDELARHIARDACVFAFCALFGLFVCVDLLRVGGVMPHFVWDRKSLQLAMMATLALGLGWSWWRYR